MAQAIRALTAFGSHPTDHLRQRVEHLEQNQQN
jgi:hypothetical protein